MPKPNTVHKLDLVSAAADGGEFALIVENKIDAICAPVLRDHRAGADQADAVMPDGLSDIVLHFCRNLHADEAAGLTLIAGIVFRRKSGTGRFDRRAREISGRPGKKRGAKQAECCTRSYGNLFSHRSTL